MSNDNSYAAGSSEWMTIAVLQENEPTPCHEAPEQASSWTPKRVPNDKKKVNKKDRQQATQYDIQIYLKYY